MTKRLTQYMKAVEQADNAWMRILYMSEQLELSNLSSRDENPLLAELAGKLRSLQSEHEEVVRQLDDFIMSARSTQEDSTATPS
jgi:hypothetical protein